MAARHHLSYPRVRGAEKELHEDDECVGDDEVAGETIAVLDHVVRLVENDVKGRAPDVSNENEGHEIEHDRLPLVPSGSLPASFDEVVAHPEDVNY